jgi:hypothetical protein
LPAYPPTADPRHTPAQAPVLCHRHKMA